MATFKHISSKNADYGAAEQYLTFEHDEFTMKPTLDGNGRLVLRDDYRISSLNCGGRFCNRLYALSEIRQEPKAGGRKEPPLYTTISSALTPVTLPTTA